VRQRLGDRWQPELLAVLENTNANASDRLRAVDVMTIFGPPPTAEMLATLARDRDPAMRAKVARLMSLRDDPSLTAPLEGMLRDSDPWVRRVACEAIIHRAGDAPNTISPATVESLIALLGDKDRSVAFSARRALEKIPAQQWQEQVLTTQDGHIFLEGAAGLLAAYPSPQTAQRILARCETMYRDKRWMGPNTTLANVAPESASYRPTTSAAADYLDLARVTQLALLRGQIPAQSAQGVSRQILAEYPTADALVNRELVKLLAYLQPPEAARELAAQVASNIPDVEKLQIAAFAPRIATGWSTDDKLTMLRYYEQVRAMEGGHSVSAYIETFARDFFATFSIAERRQVLAAGESFPTSALSVLAKLPANPGPEALAELRTLDQKISDAPGEPMARLRVGVVAVLGQSGEPESLAYLRSVYLNKPDRRAPIAMSLTQHPDGENWTILVDSLRTLEGTPALDVIAALMKVNRRPETSDPYRNTILAGLRMQNSGGEAAARLLEHWTRQRLTQPNAPAADQLAAWQKWYAGTFPQELPAELPKESQPNKWSYEELLSYLESPEGKAGNATRGAAVFQNAQCVKCHRYGGRGEALGPDLTTVANRFQAKEILESIVYPSQVVSDQYASQIIVANGKTYTGIAGRNPDGSVTILQADGQKIQLPADEIDEARASKMSSMPEGLMNPLSLEQVADLFAYLMNGQQADVATRPTTPSR
jgi:putative heme-binding domain-containing protein